jgi:hypothetical protein
MTDNDTYETPGDTIDMVLMHLNVERDFLWEPFPGTGHSTKHMRHRGFQVTNGDDADFFKQTRPQTPHPSMRLVLVSNPPFSKKKQILQRLRELGVAHVALLLPSASMYTVYFSEHMQASNQPQFQIVVHAPRCNFLDPSTGDLFVSRRGRRKGGTSFDVAWYCFEMGLPRDINFPPREMIRGMAPNEIISTTG